MQGQRAKSPECPAILQAKKINVQRGDFRLTLIVVTSVCVCALLCVLPQMPPSPANTLDPSRSSRQQQQQQQQHNPAEMYAPFSPTSVPSGSCPDRNAASFFLSFHRQHMKENKVLAGMSFFDVYFCEKPCQHLAGCAFMLSFDEDHTSGISDLQPTDTL